MSAKAFRAAVESKDLDGMMAVLSEDVVLHSPVSFKPFEGADAVRNLLGIILETFTDFRYTDELSGDGTHLLVFRANVGDKQVEGIDLLRIGADGLVEDFTVMVRPMSGVIALAQAVGPKLTGSPVPEAGAVSSG